MELGHFISISKTSNDMEKSTGGHIHAHTPCGHAHVHVCLGIKIVHTSQVVICESWMSYANIFRTMSISFGLCYWKWNKSFHLQTCFWIPENSFNIFHWVDPKVLVYMTIQYKMHLVFDYNARLAEFSLNWCIRSVVTAKVNPHLFLLLRSQVKGSKSSKSEIATYQSFS